MNDPSGISGMGPIDPMQHQHPVDDAAMAEVQRVHDRYDQLLRPLKGVTGTEAGPISDGDLGIRVTVSNPARAAVLDGLLRDQVEGVPLEILCDAPKLTRQGHPITWEEELEEADEVLLRYDQDIMVMKGVTRVSAEILKNGQEGISVRVANLPAQRLLQNLLNDPLDGVPLEVRVQKGSTPHTGPVVLPPPTLPDPIAPTAPAGYEGVEARGKELYREGLTGEQAIPALPAGSYESFFVSRMSVVDGPDTIAHAAIGEDGRPTGAFYLEVQSGHRIGDLRSSFYGPFQAPEG